MIQGDFDGFEGTEAVGFYGSGFALLLRSSNAQAEIDFFVWNQLRMRVRWLR